MGNPKTVPNKKRSDHQEPSNAKKGSSGRQHKRKLEKEQGMQGVQKKKRQQRVQSKAEATYLSPKIVQVTPGQRAKWQPLPKSTREHLETMMHWLITSLLCETTQNHSEIETHLSLLNKRLVKQFETLQVPVEKLSSLKNVHKMLAEEKKKTLALEQDLAEVEEEIDKVLPAAELQHEKIQNLQDKVQKLKLELAAEAANELFQTDGNNELGLPGISKYQLKAPILQDELLKIGNQEGLLNDLNTIQESAEMKTMLAFLEQAYENVDFVS